MSSNPKLVKASKNGEKYMWSESKFFKKTLNTKFLNWTIAAACAEIKRTKFRYLKDQVIFWAQTKLSIVTLIYNLQCKLVLRGSNEI